MSDWWNQPMNPQPAGAEGEAAGQPDAATKECPWCSTVVPTDQACCPSCGAVVAQREDLGGIVIPGVTAVDDGLRDPSLVGSAIRVQSRVNTMGTLGSMGGPSTQVVGATAYLAKDALSGMFQSIPNKEDIGRPSEAALEMIRRLGSSTDGARAGDGPTTGEPATEEPAAEGPAGGTTEPEQRPW